MTLRLSFLAAILLVGACNSGGSGSSDDQTGDDNMTGDDGSGSDPGTCSPLTPRSVDPETFIGPTGLQDRIGAFFDGAQTSLDVQMYLWTVKPLAQKLIDAKNRGVTVRVILDPDEAGNAAVEPMLTNANIPWRNASSIYTYAHAKYIVRDGSAGAIMSMNFNADAMASGSSGERNYGLIDKDPDDVKDLGAIFKQDWALASNGAETAQPADLSCTRLVVSPTNSKTRLLAHINSARQSLALEVMYLSETDVRAAVLAAKDRGVDVRVIIGDDTDDSIPMLEAKGIPVKTATSFYLHAKLIVADDVAFVGSENMSYTSLVKNREVGALVFEPSAMPVITQQFEADWTGAKTL
ncbi:MAG TPA: phospholipase D-like domain-containing protein [Kofleriaceae bacterium]|jgi:phosphatidylserine/phosphatidylglycerophosphate/cardiolipin synthase-like enzyme